MVNKLGQDIIPTYIVIKLDNDPINMSVIVKGHLLNLDNFWQFKGHNSKVLQVIWLVIKFHQESMPTINVTTFDDDPLNLAGYRTWPRYFANKHFHTV